MSKYKFQSLIKSISGNSVETWDTVQWMTKGANHKNLDGYQKLPSKFFL